MNKSTKNKLYFLGIILLIILLGVVRFYDLNMDSFPYDEYGTSWFDEGYIHNARNNALFGNWTLEGDLWNPMYISPVFTYMEFISFTFFGVNTFAMRFIIAFLSVISILIAGLLIMSRRFKEGIVYIILLSGNIMLIAFSRVAMIESILLFFILIIIGLIVYNKPISWIGAGFLTPFLFFSKITSLFFILAIPLSLIGYYLIYRSQKILKNLIIFVAGCIFSIILWLFWLIPNKSVWLYANFGGYGSRIQIGITKTIMATLFSLEFSLLNQIVLFIALISILVIIITFLKKKQILFIDFFLIISIVLFLFQIIFADYPLRRFVLIVPIISLIAARFICRLDKIDFSFMKSRFEINPNLFIFLFISFYLIITFAHLGIYFSPLVSNWDNSHTTITASKEINNYIPPGSNVYGYYAVAFAAENKIKPYYSRENNNFANSEEYIFPFFENNLINYAILEANLSDTKTLMSKNIDINNSKVYQYIQHNFKIIKELNIKNTRDNSLNEKIYIYKRTNQ